jgi:hypothetical protein
MSNLMHSSKDTFNIILDDPPIEFGGVRVRTDFKQALKFFRIQTSKKIKEKDKWRVMLGAMFWGIPKAQPEEIGEWLLWYLSGGAEKEDSEEDERLFDFNIDNGLMFSAFRQVYNIDLSVESMHWWYFLELFRGLPEGTKLSKVIEIRGKEIPAKADPKYKSEMKKLKRLYALDKEAQFKKESDALENGLKNGWG